MAEWPCSGLQIHLGWFDSSSGVHYNMINKNMFSPSSRDNIMKTYIITYLDSMHNIEGTVECKACSSKLALDKFYECECSISMNSTTGNPLTKGVLKVEEKMTNTSKNIRRRRRLLSPPKTSAHADDLTDTKSNNDVVNNRLEIERLKQRVSKYNKNDKHWR